ncbi:MAG: NAD kinase [Pseudoflavonifractor sp.]|nr:NAD kinase [Pseudoflavonifractor sp.]
MRIAVFGNNYQENHIGLLAGFFSSLASYNLWIEMEEGFYRYLCDILPEPPGVNDLISSDDFSAALALSIGGDGTFLHTARWVGDKNIPILGINTGHLGYLADVQVEEVGTLIDDIVNERYKIEARTLIEARCDRMPAGTWPYALNEVAVLKQDTASMIAVDAAISGSPVTTYKADGLIVATPTGSTGYNLAVGGPIIQPSTPCLVVSPIAAHSLTMRPLVIDDNSIIDLTTSSRSGAYRLSLDGRSLSLPADTTVTLRKAPYTIKVVQRLNHHFTDTLRTKLLWGLDKR